MSSKSGNASAKNSGKNKVYAFLGPVGTFTELALAQVPEARGQIRHATVSVHEALAAVIHGDAYRAIVPIESSVEGGVSATADALLAWFDKMVFRSKVEFVRHPELSVFFGIGTDFGLTWVDPWPEVVAGGVRYALDAPAFNGREHILAQAPQIDLVPIEAAEALRVAAHRPRQLTEVDDRSLPHELDWLSTAVHLRKGCYRGQETVAKVHNLGHPPRRLTFLHLDGSNHLLPQETNVTLGDKVVGRVTSLAQHYEMGPIALAVLSRSVDASATLMIGNVAASQEVIVPADAGKAANLPPRSELNQRR